MRSTHEYYDDRVVKGLLFSVENNGAILRISAGSAAISGTLVTKATATDLAASAFVVSGNVLPRIDIVVMSTAGVISVVHGTPGVFKMPTPAMGTMVLAQISIPVGWSKFAGAGASDEVLCLRSGHVIDTRFTAV